MKFGFIPLQTPGINNTGTLPLVAVNAVSEYQDGKPTGRHVGMAYDVLLPDQQLEHLRVKITNDSSTLVEQADLDEANLMGDCYMVRFKNLEVKPYSTSNGRISYTARAESVEVVGRLNDILKGSVDL